MIQALVVAALALLGVVMVLYVFIALIMLTFGLLGFIADIFRGEW